MSRKSQNSQNCVITLDQPRGAPQSTKGTTEVATSGPKLLPQAPEARHAEVRLLLQRMRCGDREAAAEFVTKYGSRLRRRIRGKLSSRMRRIFDSLDILSTVGRRLDSYVRQGRLQAASQEQLWSLITRMANNAVLDKLRIVRKLQRAEADDSEFAIRMLQRLEQAERDRTRSVEEELDHVFDLLTDATDRQILSLWLMGTPHFEIARYVDLSADAVRHRWQEIKIFLQQSLIRSTQ